MTGRHEPSTVLRVHADVRLSKLDARAPGLGTHLRGRGPLPGDVVFVPWRDAAKLARRPWIALIPGMAFVLVQVDMVRTDRSWIATAVGIAVLVVPFVVWELFERRRVDRYGLYLTPHLLVTFSPTVMSQVPVAPRDAVVSITVKEGREAKATSAVVEAITRRGSQRTLRWPAVNRSPAELGQLLETWWNWDVDG